MFLKKDWAVAHWSWLTESAAEAWYRHPTCSGIRTHAPLITLFLNVITGRWQQYQLGYETFTAIQAASAELALALIFGKDYCSILTKCSVTGDTGLYMMCAKITLIQKEIFRSSRRRKKPKSVNIWSKYYSMSTPSRLTCPTLPGLELIRPQDLVWFSTTLELLRDIAKLATVLFKFFAFATIVK
ncbi:hypothetical protein B0H16DRAFT_264614 [Mycena metata]|uniref:Uncharacterized protein n=1 Tax=Mycena metata TaxID=1033252 RepID=A0AAD7HRL2_9AGAR|nr:hypothetical protein B0H16DRAFT_264614 [Mycena metata]